MNVHPTSRANQQQCQKLIRKLNPEKDSRREFTLLFNTRTGELKIPQTIREIESRMKARRYASDPAFNWKELHVEVIKDKKSYHFEMKDRENQSLKPDGLADIAWRVIQETLHLLNEEPIETVSSKTSMEEVEHLPGWVGRIGREEAEKRLENKPAGTYLIRAADEMLFRTTFHLSEENHLSIIPIILTYVEGEGKISEIFLLKIDQGWTFYKDEPNLHDLKIYQYLSSPYEILHALSSIAKYPVQ